MSLREGSSLQDLKVPLAWTAAIALVVAAVIAIALVFGDRRQTIQGQAYGATRSAADAVAHPVGEVLSAPVRWAEGAVNYVGGYFFAISENRELHAEVSRLRQDRDREIALNEENGRLRAVLGLQTEPPIPMVTAQVITDARGPFANSRLANAGAEQGVAVGNPVMSERGLVGRVVGVAHGASRVLVLTDVASKTPVLILRTGSRAILTGDGGPNPRLDYMRGVNPVQAGDRVLTSGDGGVFPRGLPVGTAEQGLDGTWRVRLDSDDAPIDFVRILKFTDFSALASQPRLNEAPPPAITPAEEADRQARLAPPPMVSSAVPGSAQATAAAANAAGKPVAGAKPALPAAPTNPAAARPSVVVRSTAAAPPTAATKPPAVRTAPVVKPVRPKPAVHPRPAPAAPDVSDTSTDNPW